MGHMRGTMLGGAIVATLLFGAPANASVQRVRGTVVVPAAWEGCGGYADAVLETAARAGGLIDYEFPVSQTTWNKPFTLRPDLPTADIDISFSSSPATPRTRFSSGTIGGEAGIVPAGAVEARVCLFAGTPTGFTYTAG